MSSLILELVTQASADPELQRYIELPIVSHVHARIESFVYHDAISDDAVPLTYFESPPILSRKNLHITDRSYQVSANSDKLLDPRVGLERLKSASYSSVYSNIAITNQTFIDQNNRKRPLFWRHKLDALATDVQLEVIKNGNYDTVDTGYRIELGEAIYTNYQNYFDSRGNYVAHFITSTVDGVQKKELLNPTLVVAEGTWEDIDLTTGDFYTDRAVYSIEKNTSGYSYYFSVSDEWWIRPQAKSLLKCRYPAGVGADEAWYTRITNGDVTAVVNGESRRYWLPEFLRQPYQPSFPYIFTPYNKLSFVAPRLVGATRGSLAIDPASSRHVTIYIYDVQGNLLKVWTTDESLESTRYSNTSVLYELKIDCWDNQSGLISVTEPILPAWNFYGSFYYEADDLEYTGLDLNPIQKPKILSQTVIFYVVPNADQDDNGLHYLLVERDGRISYCSQSLGFSYPNLQLLNADDTPNASSVIGIKYSSETESSSFLTTYTAGYDNSYGYMVLAEVNVIDDSSISRANAFDVSREGGTLHSDAFSANPKALQSIYGYGEDGAQVPVNNVVLIDADLDLLTDYGGNLEQVQAEQLFTKYMPAGTYPLIDWNYPYSEVTLDIGTAGSVTVTWTYEGDYTYRLYRKLETDWVLINEQEGDADFTYTDSVDSGSIVYYEVRVFSDYEYPAPYFTTAQVR